MGIGALFTALLLSMGPNRRGSRNFWWGDDMDEEKIGRGLGAAVGPQRGPGAEPLVGVKGAKPPTKVTLFSRIIQ
jgi:hypothetical protein